MRKVLLTLLFTSFIVTPSWAAGWLPLVSGTGGGVALSVDGSVLANSSNSSTPAVLACSSANDVLVVEVAANGAPTITVNDSVIGSGWTKRATTAGQPLEEWWNTYSGTYNGTITASLSSAAFTTVIAFCVHGAHVAAPWDANGSLPNLPASGGTPSVSTSATNTMVIGAFRQNSTSAPTAGAGFTPVQSGDFAITEYKIVSTTQSSLAVTTSATADNNGAIGDAIVQGP